MRFHCTSFNCVSFYLLDLLVYKCMSVTLLCTIFYVYIIWTCLSEINLYNNILARLCCMICFIIIYRA